MWRRYVIARTRCRDSHAAMLRGMLSRELPLVAVLTGVVVVVVAAAAAAAAVTAAAVVASAARKCNGRVVTGGGGRWSSGEGHASSSSSSLSCSSAADVTAAYYSCGGGGANEMCALSRGAPEHVSRTSVAFGVASLAILLTGFVTGSWVTTREPYRVPGSDAYTAAVFRIGLWKVCPTLRKINSTLNFRSLSCKYIRYTSDWDLDLAKEDIGIDSDVYFTQSFVAKMRWCTPLVSISLCLMLAGCVFSFSGHYYKDQKTLIASSLHTLAGLILAAGLFVFASVLNDAFSPVVYQSADDNDEGGGGGGGGGGGTAAGDGGGYDDDDGFDGAGRLRPDYDYRYGWSFVACSLAFLASEASAVFTITAYFRRLEDRVRYTAVDRKPSPDTPPPSSARGLGGDRSSACSADSPDRPHHHHHHQHHNAADADRRADSAAVVTAASGMTSGGGHGRHCVVDPAAAAAAASSSSSPSPSPSPSGGCGGGGGGGAPEANGTVSKTPPDICPSKIGDDAPPSGHSPAAVKQPAAAYCSATLSHPQQHKHHLVHQQQHHVQHYRQTLAVAGNGSCYEVDTSKPCTCTSAATAVATTTKRYATIAGVARHGGGGKQLYTCTSLTNHNGGGGGGGKRPTTTTATGLASIKEADHHLHHLQHQQQHHNGGGGTLHHRKPDPPTRRLKGGYVVPQTPIAALEALDCPPAADPRLVMPSSV